MVAIWCAVFGPAIDFTDLRRQLKEPGAVAEDLWAQVGGVVALVGGVVAL